jgi:hypothetical protein
MNGYCHNVGIFLATKTSVKTVSKYTSKILIVMKVRDDYFLHIETNLESC